ncbi:MAG: hypothetical protein MUE50_00595 [Pirellulaceae bacterium]|nr:hypothetical protein [Pirellulaceae bacterium]
MSDPVSSIAVNSSGAWQILAVRRWGSLIHARRHQAFRLQETPPVLAGWNVWFDVSFLKHMLEQAEIKWPFD